ncbi:hypothetical protein Tco_0071018 [Tanacetum coccineum]
MLYHEVGRLCDEYAWWKLTRRCWNIHVLAAAAISTKGEIWSLNQPRNGTRSLVRCLREYSARLFGKVLILLLPMETSFVEETDACCSSESLDRSEALLE